MNGAQELDRLLHTFPHGRELLEQLRPERGLQGLSGPHHIQRKIEAHERRRQWIGDFVGNHTGLAHQLGQSIRLGRARPAHGRRLIHEP